MHIPFHISSSWARWGCVGTPGLTEHHPKQYSYTFFNIYLAGEKGGVKSNFFLLLIKIVANLLQQDKAELLKNSLKYSLYCMCFCSIFRFLWCTL